MNNNKITIYLLCSPNLGVLDNWLPVLFQIYNNNKNYRFVLLFPNSTIVSSICFDNAINKIADKIFDLIIVQTIPGEWMKFDSLVNSKKWCESNYVITKVFKYIELIKLKYPKVYKLISSLIYLYTIIFRYKNRKKIVHLDKQIYSTDVLLYDVHVRKHGNVSKILFLFSGNYKFSMPHGIGIRLKLDHIVKANNNNNNKLKIYLFSNFFERDYYIKKHGVNDDNLNFFGIPRHDYNWINEIQRQSQILPPGFQNGNTIFIISSPVSACLPMDRKIKSLINIEKVLQEGLGMNLVIKLHPKEAKEGIYEDVFGIKEYGKTWVYSGLHPFALAKGRKLAISLFSGVSFDMLRLGVPCIEYIDLQGIPGFDDIVDKKPITPFARYGLVTSVSNYSELEYHVNRIMKSSNYHESYIKVYKKYFIMDDKSSDKIASNILELIPNKAINQL